MHHVVFCDGGSSQTSHEAGPKSGPSSGAQAPQKHTDAATSKLLEHLRQLLVMTIFVFVPFHILYETCLITKKSKNRKFQKSKVEN